MHLKLNDQAQRTVLCKDPFKSRDERVERLILLAPAGLHHNAGVLAETARRLPWVGDWMMLALGAWRLRKTAGRRRISAWPGWPRSWGRRWGSELARVPGRG